MDSHGTSIARLVDWGTASHTLDREAGSGDRAVAKLVQEGMLLAVVDGLGHGKQAAEAAAIAVTTVHEFTRGPITSIFSACHERLKGTRGVVMSLALIHAAGGTITWAGVGNVEGLLIRQGLGSTIREASLMLGSGVIGDHLPSVKASTKILCYGDAVIMSTDGIRAGFDERLNLRSSPQQIAESILATHRRDDDDALVLVARYVGS